ncbi:MAG: hypothetical protein H7A25_11310 [Leptospiraceae bacterium]|nr:hypothetical protein [Leptospiraceae bacterium]
MSIPKKGSRKIIVNNIEFRWRVRHKPTYLQGAFGHIATAAIELFEHPVSVLLVKFPFARCDNWLGISSLAITPALLERVINKAIEEGWKSTSSEKYFLNIMDDFIENKDKH